MFRARMAHVKSNYQLIGPFEWVEMCERNPICDTKVNYCDCQVLD